MCLSAMRSQWLNTKKKKTTVPEAKKIYCRVFRIQRKNGLLKTFL